MESQPLPGTSFTPFQGSGDQSDLYSALCLFASPSSLLQLNSLLALSKSLPEISSSLLQSPQTSLLSPVKEAPSHGSLASANHSETSSQVSTPLSSPGRKHAIPIPEEKKDAAYFERRRRNNDAARRSRDARRRKEEAVLARNQYLEEENEKLREELAALTVTVQQLKLLVHSRTSAACEMKCS